MHVEPRGASSARSDWDIENAAAFEIEYDGIIANAAKAVVDSTLTMVPRVFVSNGREAAITAYGPKRLTARCRSIVARSLKSSYCAIPALFTRTSSDSTCASAVSICAVSVRSRISGVTRASLWVKGWRVAAYTLRAPRRRASSTSARPIPRLAPVTSTALSAMVILVVSIF